MIEDESQYNSNIKYRSKDDRNKYWETKNNNVIYSTKKSKSTPYYYDVTPPTFSYSNFYNTDKNLHSNKNQEKESGIFSNSGRKNIVNISVLFFICQISILLD